jgi:2-hydroxy-6-oxonona-2,4-dienedioate hydrolase
LDAAVDWTTPGPDAVESIARVEATGERTTTPYHGGEVVWHCWGEGRPLVLLHGGFGSWGHWIRNIEALSAHYRLLIPDMPGFGDSGDPPEPFSPEGIADALADGLRQLAPDQPLLITGFSFGSIIGGLIAQRARVPVKLLVLVGAAGLGLPRKPMDLVSWRHLKTDSERREAHRENVAILMLWDRNTIDDVAVELQDRSTGRARVNSRRISRTPILLAALENSTVPLAGIWGEHDATAEPYLNDRRLLLEQLRPGLPFVVIPNAGHWVQYEKADEFNATLMRVLAKHA